MGEVYEAVHTVIGRRVAIKVLRAGADEALNAARRLLEEARAVNAIHHPGIIDVFDAGVFGERRPYLVMELLEGQSLAERLKAHGKLPLPELFHVLTGVLEALGAAHKVGVIHRDLKPSNVFLVKTPGPSRVKLLDFGVARREGREEALTAPEMAVGSVGFMAPEQLQGQAVPQSDLYAVGCLAFLMAAGRPVFSLKSIPDAAKRHLHEKPPLLRALRPDAPEPLEAWVDWLLKKTAGERPRTAEAALNSLKSVQAEKPEPRTEPVLGVDPAVKSLVGAYKKTELVPALTPAPGPALGSGKHTLPTDPHGVGPVPRPQPERPTTLVEHDIDASTDRDSTILDS